MTDKQQDENKISVPSGWSISPSILKTLQETADTFKRHNEAIQRSLEGPMKDWARFAEIQKKQQAEMEAVLKTINLPKLNLEWINKAALAFQKATEKPVYLSSPVMTVYHKPETSSPSEEDVATRQETNELLRQLVEERRRSNDIQEIALKKQATRKKQKGLQVLVLNKDGHLSIQIRPKKILDLSKSPQKRKILAALTSRFISTKILFATSGCSSMDAFYKAIEDLKADVKRVFHLKTDLITNDRKQGYCITSVYTFQIE